jgi:hypothetical protein
MENKERLLKKRANLMTQLVQHVDAVSGNLSKSAVPPGSANFYWRITWKEKQKTKIQYVRPEALNKVRKGIEHFAHMKKLIHQIGDINRTILLCQDKRSS